MRLVFCVAITVSFVACSSQTNGYLPGTARRSAPVLIIFSGESNAGGYALNSQASPSELSSSAVQILNNFTMKFENLKIGVNNKLGHTGHEDNWYVTHGWELELAIRASNNVFGASLVYLVKTAQGASKISNWAVGGVYSDGAGHSANCWDTMQKRVDTAIALLTRQTGTTPTLYLFYSQGINDATGGTNVTTWKTATLDHFTKIRSKYGEIPIVMTKFMSNYGTYNTAIDEVAASTSNCFTVVTSDATLRDANHWDYSGMRLVADRMINAVQ